MTVRPFKDNGLMRDKYYDEIHCGKSDELNYFEVLHVKIILRTIEKSCILYSHR